MTPFLNSIFLPRSMQLLFTNFNCSLAFSRLKSLKGLLFIFRSPRYKSSISLSGGHSDIDVRV